MGLDDVLDGKVPDGKRSGGSSSSSDQSEQIVKIGSPPNQKKFTKDRWEEVKEAITGELGYTTQEVLEDMPSNKRHEIVHEAAMISSSDMDPEDSQTRPTKKCPICDEILREEMVVEIAGMEVHAHHTAAQVEKALDQ